MRAVHAAATYGCVMNHAAGSSPTRSPSLARTVTTGGLFLFILGDVLGAGG